MPKLGAFLPEGTWPDELLLSLLRAVCAGAVLAAERNCTRAAAALLVRAPRRLKSPQHQADLRRQLKELEEQVRRSCALLHGADGLQVPVLSGSQHCITPLVRFTCQGSGDGQKSAYVLLPR
jgi:hypothetical protein